LKLNFRFLKEEIGNYYRKEFFFLVLGLFLLGGSLFIFIKEFKKFSALQESLSKIEQSYFRIQPEIVRLKEALSKVNWQREFRKETLEITAQIDLRNLKSAYQTLKSLSNTYEDTYFLLKEMTYKEEKERPVLILKGEKVIYR